MADTVEIDVVTLEHHRENIGIGEPRPRISWKLKNAPAFWIQSAYEIEILSSVSPDPQVFHVESSDSILVPWPAKALISRHSLAVRVKVYGTEPCDWSHPVIVEAGLLSRSDWTSQLIATKRILAPNGTLTPILFRKEFAILNNQ
jgi:alpha-L-rhamnosidase